jgi:aromatic-amino-acid transaminase
MSASIFTAVEMAPRDPILGLTEQFNADPNPAKVNLGVGVYFNDEGKLPVLRCVAEAEKQLLAAPKAKNYLPIDGMATYDKAVQGLVFGNDSEAVTSGRVATVQALGGTGGLKVGADFLRRLNPAAKVLISDPSWENHRALFTNAGFVVETYPYYDAATRDIRFDAMLAALRAAAPGTVVVLHACCHNPTGYDITPAQWEQVAAACQQAAWCLSWTWPTRASASASQQDGAGRAQLPGHRHELLRLDFVLQELFAVRRARGRAQRGLRQQGRGRARAVAAEDRHPLQLQHPPTFGAQVVSHGADHAGPARDVGRRTGRHARPHQEHAPCPGGQAAGRGREGRSRLHHTPDGHVQLLGPDPGTDAAPAQRVRRLRLDSGRICVAALNSRNIDAVASALAKVM